MPANLSGFSPDSPPVLVTGAAGFIGSHLCEALLAMGESVVGVDNFDGFYARHVKDTNLRGIQASAERHVGAGGASNRWAFVEADIRRASDLHPIFEQARPRGVIHLAAKAGVRPSIQDPASYMDVNVTGTAVVLEQVRMARTHGCDRVVIASSSSVYGNASEAPFREDMDVSMPISPYAASKRACELIGATHYQLTGIPTACLRFFTAYGPRQRPDLAIATFMRKMAGGETIELFGDTSSARDYTYIDDIVLGVIMAFKRIPRYGYRIWNLGGSNPVSLSDLVAAIERVAGKPADVRLADARAGDVKRTWADTKRSQAELQFEAKIGLEEGLRRQWEAQR
ncbi:MAG: GDP-mannose 4,6-dehydratase [Planctomycetota bacterium]|nr:GDP-mannose 4,6-dehydratase [Planctomycetota bacterium]